ncbi:hypothetical protein ACFZBU_45570 [Embleya sp. NPDC008237]|uniref:AraC-like ligand-binding domain-containing protein n=1 Tax=Embleya sp. NPDC008237 TaxID=3363978 RepID=UPI0036ED27D4
MDVVLDTASPPVADPAATVQDAFARRLARIRVTVRPGPFSAVLSEARFGYVRLLEVQADALRLARTSRLVAEHPGTGVAVAFQRHGTGELTQDGRGTFLRDGELCLLDLRRPFALRWHGRFTLRLVRLPDRALAVPEAVLAAGTGRAISASDGRAGFLLPLLERPADVLAPLAPAVADRLAGHTAEILAAVLTQAAAGADRVPRTGRPAIAPIGASMPPSVPEGRSGSPGRAGRAVN